MVIPAEKRAILPPARRSIPQSRLHNFSFPTISWGSQKLLRCVNPSIRSNDERPQTAVRCSSSSSPKDEAKEANPLDLCASKPWNLRSRRAARNPSPSSSQSRSSSYSPLQKEKMSGPMVFVTRLEELERRKFSIALSREEIEEDFLAAKGTKPPRRPKKRAKYLQKQLDSLFPGVFLSEVTSDLYKIEEIGS